MLEIRSVTAWLKSCAGACLDFLYPPCCPLCQAELNSDSADSHGADSHREWGAVRLCDSCQREVSVRGPTCLRCAADIGPNLSRDGCPLCREEHYQFAGVVRLGVYKSLLKTACLRMKYPGSEPLSSVMADLLWEFEGPALQASGIDLVIPVPRHWWRRWRGGREAQQVLAEVWGGRLNVPVETSILRKVRWTVRQASLKPHLKRTNLRGAFAVPSGVDLSGATILLADDIMTSGSTANEATKVLKKAGARKVLVAVVGRGLGK